MSCPKQRLSYFDLTRLADVSPGLSSSTTNQNSLFRSRDWLSANEGPLFPDSVGSFMILPTRTHDSFSKDDRLVYFCVGIAPGVYFANCLLCISGVFLGLPSSTGPLKIQHVALCHTIATVMNRWEYNAPFPFRLPFHISLNIKMRGTQVPKTINKQTNKQTIPSLPLHPHFWPVSDEIHKPPELSFCFVGVPPLQELADVSPGLSSSSWLVLSNKSSALTNSPNEGPLFPDSLDRPFEKCCTPEHGVITVQFLWTDHFYLFCSCSYPLSLLSMFSVMNRWEYNAPFPFRLPFHISLEIVNLTKENKREILGKNNLNGSVTVFRFAAERCWRYLLKGGGHVSSFDLTRLADVSPGLSSSTTNQNSLFRSRDWLSANEGPLFPDSVGSFMILPTRTHDSFSKDDRLVMNRWEYNAPFPFRLPFHISLNGEHQHSSNSIGGEQHHGVSNSIGGEQHHGASKADLGLIYAALLLGQGISMIIGGLAERKWGTRTLALFAVTLFNISLILFRWSLSSVTFLALNYLLAGFSLGFTKVICLVVGLSWVEKDNHGLASGLIFAAFGLSSAIVSPLQTLFINPLNQPPVFNPSVGEFLFTDPKILSAVPKMFTIFAIISAVIQLPLATLLVKRPVVESYEGKWGVQEMLKRYEFYVLFAIFALNKIPIAYVSSYAKIYGETFLDADMFLSLVLGVAGVFNSLGRPFWGFIQDKLGVRWSLALISFFTSLSVILSFLCGFTEHDASIPYTLTTWASFFCVSGNYAVFPAATARYFGDHGLGLKYGVLYTSQGVGAILSALYMGLIPFWTPLLLRGRQLGQWAWGHNNSLVNYYQQLYNFDR
eukprot:sb/3462079/